VNRTQAESERQVLDISGHKQIAISILQRLTRVHRTAQSGIGVVSEKPVPLCKYYNRCGARGLIRLLEDKGVRWELRTTRRYVLLLVCREDFATASELLKNYEIANPHIRQNWFSNDCDAAIVIGFVSVFLAGIITSLPLGLNQFASIAVLINGASFAILADRWKRNDRYQVGMRFSLAGIMGLTTFVALNIAVWRIAISEL
jgi:hypothetical protein